MDDPLHVQTRDDLVNFVETLLEELKEHPEQWENATLERYLEALARYLRDLPGWCQNVEPTIDPETAQWRLLAVALAGAQIYE